MHTGFSNNYVFFFLLIYRQKQTDILTAQGMVVQPAPRNVVQPVPRNGGAACTKECGAAFTNECGAACTEEWWCSLYQGMVV